MKQLMEKELRSPRNQLGNYLKEVEFFNAPYPYFISEKALPAKLADKLFTWISESIQWNLHEESFFEQYEAVIHPDKVPEAVASFFTTESLSQIRSCVAKELDVELDEKIKIVAHKLEDQQSIGIHNDNPEGTLETHRLVINFNNGYEDEYGGQLIVFNSPDLDGVNAVYRPIHNSAFGFSMSAYSYHAVNRVNGWNRYSLVFSFWEKNRKPTFVFEAGEYKNTAIAKAVEYLIKNNADATTHSGHYLLGHLLNTYSILKKWGCEETLCNVGLFHSIYGTSEFATATVPVSKRAEVTAIIGKEAEALAYLFCFLSPDALADYYYENEKIESTLSLGLRNGQQVTIDRQIYFQLVIIDIVNSVEQIGRVEIGEKRLQREKIFYLNVLSLMPSFQEQQAIKNNIMEAYL